MRSLIKIILTVTIIFSGSQLAAQDKSKTLLQTEKMATELGLSEKQKATLDKELKATQAARKAKVEKIRALMEEMRRDAFVERQAREKRLKEILTPEQWTKYESQKKTRRKKVASRWGQGKRGRANFRNGRGQFRQQGMRRGRFQRGMQFMKKRKELKEEKKENSGDGGE